MKKLSLITATLFTSILALSSVAMAAPQSPAQATSVDTEDEANLATDAQMQATDEAGAQDQQSGDENIVEGEAGSANDTSDETAPTLPTIAPVPTMDESMANDETAPESSDASDVDPLGAPADAVATDETSTDTAPADTAPAPTDEAPTSDTAPAGAAPTDEAPAGNMGSETEVAPNQQHSSPDYQPLIQTEAHNDGGDQSAPITLQEIKKDSRGELVATQPGDFEVKEDRHIISR